MKKTLFFLFLGSAFLIADSLDNAIIEQTRAEKEQLKEAKKVQSQDKNTKEESHQEDRTTDDSKQNVTDTNKDKEDQTKNTQDDAMQQKEQRESTQQNAISQKDSPPKQSTSMKGRTQWLAGGYFGSNIRAFYQEQEAQSFDMALQFGILYYIREQYGIKGFLSAFYSSINNDNIFLLGVGVDAFYKFRYFGIFIGASFHQPISSDVLKDGDVLINAGLSFDVSQNVRVEARVGYPVVHDTRYERILTVGANIYYIFGNSKTR